MGSFDVLGLGLSGVRIDMCWNFNGCGDFCGEILGVGVVKLRELKVVQRVDFVGLVVVGRG